MKTYVIIIGSFLGMSMAYAQDPPGEPVKLYELDDTQISVSVSSRPRRILSPNQRYRSGTAGEDSESDDSDEEVLFTRPQDTPNQAIIAGLCLALSEMSSELRVFQARFDAAPTRAEFAYVRANLENFRRLVIETREVFALPDLYLQVHKDLTRNAVKIQRQEAIIAALKAHVAKEARERRTAEQKTEHAFSHCVTQQRAHEDEMKALRSMMESIRVAQKKAAVVKQDDESEREEEEDEEKE